MDNIVNKAISEEELTCISKRKYANKRKALIGAFFYQTKTPLAPYKCPVCRKWHITKNKEQVRKWEKKWDLKLLIKKRPEQLS